MCLVSCPPFPPLQSMLSNCYLNTTRPQTYQMSDLRNLRSKTLATQYFLLVGHSLERGPNFFSLLSYAMGDIAFILAASPSKPKNLFSRLFRFFHK